MAHFSSLKRTLLGLGVLTLFLAAVGLNRLFWEVRQTLRSDDPQAKYEDLQSAQRAVRDQVELHPSDPQAHYKLARLMSPSGDAKQQFEMAVRLDPAFKEARLGLANAYEISRDYQSAIKTYKAIPRFKSDPEILCLLANNYSCLKQYSKAENLFFQAIALEPNSPDYRYYLAGAYYSAGDRVEARRQWEMVMQQGGGPGSRAEQAQEWLRICNNSTASKTVQE